MCAWTSSTIKGGILWNFSLKGSLSTTLISCLTKSVQPNSPGSREKMLCYSANRAHAATWFLSDHSSRPDKSSCWRSNFFLCLTIILVWWIPCISSNFSRVLGVSFTGGTTFAVTTWATLMHLGDSDSGWPSGLSLPLWLVCSQKSHKCTFSPHSSSGGKWGPSLPFQGLSHYMHVISQQQGFHSAVYYFGSKKLSTSSVLVVLTSFIQVGWIHSLVCNCRLLMFRCSWSNWYLGSKSSRFQYD